MFDRLKSMFGRKKVAAPIDSPLARYAAGRAAPGPISNAQPRSVPPPPPPARVEPQPDLPGAAESAPQRARVKVILDDGTIAELPDDPDIREQMERLADQILPGREER